MPTTTMRARLRVVAVAVAPAVLLAALAYHPYVAKPTDKAAVADAFAADTTRWGLAHLAVAFASGLLLLALLAVRSYLREVGEDRWSGLAVPFVVVGSTLFALLPAMEVATVAAVEAGADAQAFQTELDPWFIPVLLASAITFAAGILSLAMGVARSGILGRRLARVVVAAMLVMVVSRFVPLGASLLVGGGSAVVALWPLAYAMWQREALGERQARAVPAT